MDAFKRWFDNFWEYNKWKVVIASIALAVILVTLPTLIDNPEPDASIMYVGPPYISQVDITDINKSASTFLKSDYNGDGRMSIDINTFIIASMRGTSTHASTVFIAYDDELYNSFYSEVNVGDSCIYIVDLVFYEKLKEMNYIVKLDTLFDWLPEDTLEDGYGIPFGSLSLSKLKGFSSIPDDLIVCFRIRRNDEDEEFYLQNKEFLESVFALDR